MHLSGALYKGRNSKLGKKVDKSTLESKSGESSTVAVSGQEERTDGSTQQHCPSIRTRGDKDDDKPPARRESAPHPKLPNTSSRRKKSSSRDTSVVMGRGRSHSLSNPPEVPFDIVRTGSASPRRTSLFCPDPALADDKDDATVR
ncbi:hypothetical protein DHEL01_v203213 [Diaporthe helianthi]|uniref:Uncharacterized protein n=1 Tax=Diaporthe helianthi TaxID=158607 RepID=A0A2P5I7C0_DIAHE|nr:hypothetical protein DHEL01_v203213 [Diaporthe helianthi]